MSNKIENNKAMPRVVSRANTIALRTRPKSHETTLEQRAAENVKEAICVVADVVALNIMKEARKISQDSVSPAPYVPVSKLMTGFMKLVAEKMVAIYLLLTEDEQQRVRRIAPAFARALDSDTNFIAQYVVQTLLPMEPTVAAEWIRQSLDALELGFPS
jgi:hypothetical protein